MKKVYLALVGSIVVLLLAGCSLGGGAESEPNGKRRPQSQATNESSPQTNTTTESSSGIKPETTDRVQNRQSASVRVDPTRETRLRVPDGPLIVLPAGSTSGSGELVAEKSNDAPRPPTDIVSASGGAWDLHLEDTELTGSVQLQFPVQPPKDVPAKYVEMLLTFYDQQQGEWVPVESEYDKQQQTVTATVDHLSLWNPLTWDYQGLFDTASSELGKAIAGEEPKQPQCPNEDSARADGTRVFSADGSRIKWCYGQDDDGKPLLRVTNGRGYPALVSYPKGWEIQRQRSDSLSQALGARAVESITALPKDREGVLLDKGQMVTLYPEREPGKTVYVGAKPSSGGYIVNGLEYAGSTVETIAGRVPGSKKPKGMSTKILKSCAPELANKIGAGIVDQDTRDIYTELGGESLHCAAGQAGVPTQAKDFLGGAVNWLADGSRQVVAGSRGIADTVRDPYWISITFPEDPATNGESGPTNHGSEQSGNPRCINGIPDRNGDGEISSIEAAQAGADATQGEGPCSGNGYAGDQGSQTSDSEQYQREETGLLEFDGNWFVHGVEMHILWDATSSQIANAGPCITSIDYNGPMCKEIRLIEFSEAPSGGIVGEIIKIRHETREGDPPPPGFEPNSEVKVGDRFRLEFVDDNLLRTTWLDDLSHLNGGPGNPYWCNSQTSEENVPKCGA